VVEMMGGDRNTIRQGCSAQWANFMMWDFCEEQQLTLFFRA